MYNYYDHYHDGFYPEVNANPLNDQYLAANGESIPLNKNIQYNRNEYISLSKICCNGMGEFCQVYGYNHTKLYKDLLSYVNAEVIYIETGDGFINRPPA